MFKQPLLTTAQPSGNSRRKVVTLVAGAFAIVGIAALAITSLKSFGSQSAVSSDVSYTPATAGDTGSASIASIESNAAAATDTVVTTFSAGSFSPQCNNGQWALFGLTISVSQNVDNTGATLPMAEKGLGTYNMNFFINGQATTVTTSGVFNVGNSKTSGNTWTFDILDDQPVIGGSFFLGASGICQQNQAASSVTIQASFTTTTAVTGTLPRTFSGVVPTVVNNLPAANQFNGNNGGTTGGTGTTPTNAPAPTNAPTNAPTTVTTDTVVTTFSAGAFSPQCNNGQWALFGLTISVSQNVDNTGATLPMAEKGLGTYNMNFFINGQATTVTTNGVFNVGNSKTSGNTWTFDILDDQPVIGGSFFLGASGICQQNQAASSVTIQASFSTTTPVSGTVPRTFSNVIPTVVNSLATANQFNGNNNGGTNQNQPTNAPTNSPTKGATVTTPTNAPTNAPTAGATPDTVVTTFSANAFNPQCSNGQWALFGFGLSVTQNVDNTGATLPMAEKGLGTYNMNFFIGGQAVPVTVSNTFNVGNSKSSGNTWTFDILDDQPNIGGNFILGASGICTQNQAASTVTIQASFSTSTPVSGTVPRTFSNVVPTVVNNLPAGNRFTGSTGQSPTPSPTAPTPSPTAPTPAVTTAPPSASNTSPTPSGTGTSNQLVLTQNFDTITALSGAAPTWTTVTPACSGTGALALDSTVSASAPNSMKVTGIDGFCNHIFLGATGLTGASDLFVRFRIRLQSALGAGHGTLVTMIDSNTGKNIRFGGQSNIFIWNRETDDATLPILSPQGIALGFKPAALTWYCVEFGWVHTGTSVNVTTWIDGNLIVGQSNGNPTADANWVKVTSYSLTSINFGYEGYGNAGNNIVWYDDIKTGGTRIGC